MADTGTIKWFSNTKGFGFILNKKGRSDIFVHYSAIVIDGYKTLKAGQSVNYDAQESDKGLRAVNVIPLKRRKSRPR